MAECLALERINRLLDEGSFVEVGALVSARTTDFTVNDQSAPSDGVITGYGQIEGNPVYVYSQNRDVLNGTMGEMHAKKIAKLYDMADKAAAPDRTVRLRRFSSAGICRCTGQLWMCPCKAG